MMSWDPTWDDAGSAWRAKVNRARAHIEALGRLVGEFHESEPYSLTSEPVDANGRVPYRLRISKQVPVAISVTIGDVLSNLRAALESLAYEIARLGQGGTLSPEQQGVPTFPIRASPQAFDAFFDKKKGALYDSRARTAMRAVQPFTRLETLLSEGVEMSVDYAPMVRAERTASARCPLEHRQASAADRPGLVARRYLVEQQGTVQSSAVAGRRHDAGRLHPVLHRGR